MEATAILLTAFLMIKIYLWRNEDNYGQSVAEKSEQSNYREEDPLHQPAAGGRVLVLEKTLFDGS